MRTTLAYVALFITPFFFASNAIYGRLAQDMGPFTLAFIRWSLTGGILLALSWATLGPMVRAWRSHIGFMLGMGGLAVVLAGGVVYWALGSTTATNGLLIYTLPPALVIVLEYVVKGRPSHPREWLGIALAFCGVIWIIAQGDLARLAGMRFNPGDLLFLAAAIGWAFYSFGLKQPVFEPLGTVPTLALVALSGIVVVSPLMLVELATLGTQALPRTHEHWLIIGGIVTTASLGAFILYNFGIRVLGPSVASIFMYMLAPVGVLEAAVFLGERMASYHWVGAAAVIGGVVLATLPTRLIFGRRLK